MNYFTYCCGWLNFVMAIVTMIGLGKNWGTLEYSNSEAFSLIMKTAFCAALYSYWYLELKSLENKKC